MPKIKALAAPAAIFLLLMGAVLPASAADWVKIGQTAEGDQFFIDYDSIQNERQSDIVTVWVKDLSPDGSYILFLDSFDVSSKSTYDVLVSYNYDSRGAMTGSNTNSTTFYIVPGSIAESVYMAVRRWLNR